MSIGSVGLGFEIRIEVVFRVRRTLGLGLGLGSVKLWLRLCLVLHVWFTVRLGLRFCSCLLPVFSSSLINDTQRGRGLTRIHPVCHRQGLCSHRGGRTKLN